MTTRRKFLTTVGSTAVLGKAFTNVVSADSGSIEIAAGNSSISVSIEASDGTNIDEDLDSGTKKEYSVADDALIEKIHIDWSDFVKRTQTNYVIVDTSPDSSEERFELSGKPSRSDAIYNVVYTDRVSNDSVDNLENEDIFTSSCKGRIDYDDDHDTLQGNGSLQMLECEGPPAELTYQIL